MRNGQLYVLSSWHVNSDKQSIQGKGVLLDVNRQFIRQGACDIALDSVALLETNVERVSKEGVLMSIGTGISLFFSVGILLALVSYPY